MDGSNTCNYTTNIIYFSFQHYFKSRLTQPFPTNRQQNKLNWLLNCWNIFHYWNWQKAKKKWNKEIFWKQHFSLFILGYHYFIWVSGDFKMSLSIALIKYSNMQDSKLGSFFRILEYTKFQFNVYHVHAIFAMHYY